jgi:hypothetical protein
MAGRLALPIPGGAMAIETAARGSFLASKGLPRDTWAHWSTTASEDLGRARVPEDRTGRSSRGLQRAPELRFDVDRASAFRHTSGSSNARDGCLTLCLIHTHSPQFIALQLWERLCVRRPVRTRANSDALTWKAGWVNALAGSNPASSASVMSQDIGNSRTHGCGFGSFISGVAVRVVGRCLGSAWMCRG